MLTNVLACSLVGTYVSANVDRGTAESVGRELVRCGGTYEAWSAYAQRAHIDRPDISRLWSGFKVDASGHDVIERMAREGGWDGSGVFENTAATLLRDVTDMTGDRAMQPRPELIHGILRRGHTMQLMGPPKAGKSWALESLCWAVATEGEWMGFQCEGGSVLLADTELDEPSLSARLERTRVAKGCPVPEPGRFRVLSLRGKAARIRDVVAVVQQAFDEPPSLVVLDSLYSFETGDENSVGDMRSLMAGMGQLASLGCSVVWAHHHAKGDAGGRNVVDRGAGSGIFGRAPDALVDLSPLYVPPDSDEEAELQRAFGGRNVVPMRMGFVLREFADPGNKDVVFDFPTFAETDITAGLAERGSAAAASAAAKAARDTRTDESWQARDAQIAAALESCRVAKVPATKAEVIARWPGYDKPTEEQLKYWLGGKGKSRFSVTRTKGNVWVVTEKR